MSKGSKRRPGKGYEDNYDRIFKKRTSLTEEDLRRMIRMLDEAEVPQRGRYWVDRFGVCRSADTGEVIPSGKKKPSEEGE